jgi:hypothetical protein
MQQIRSRAKQSRRIQARDFAPRGNNRPQNIVESMCQSRRNIWETTMARDTMQLIAFTPALTEIIQGKEKNIRYTFGHSMRLRHMHHTRLILTLVRQEMAAAIS